MQYDKLKAEFASATDTRKVEILTDLNHVSKISIRKIAEILGINANTLSRRCVKLGFSPISRSEAISESMRTSKNHPTRGRERTEAEKIKVGIGQAAAWENPSQERLAANEKSSKRWGEISKEEKKKIMGKASAGLRASAKNGSKLEHFLRQKLYENGFSSIQHKVGVLTNNKDFEFDLYISELGTIIEVDGPTHFEPIWGPDQLGKNMTRDQKKTALAIDAGFRMIRVKQMKNYSMTYFNSLFEKVLNIVQSIKECGANEKYFSVE